MILHPCITFGVLSHQFPKLLDKTRFDDAAAVFIIKPIDDADTAAALYMSASEVDQSATRENILSIIKENPEHYNRILPMGSSISDISTASIASQVIGGICGFIGSYSMVMLGMGGRPKSDLDHEFDHLHRGLVVSAKILLAEKESIELLPQVVILDVRQIVDAGPGHPLTKTWIGYTNKT